MIVVLADVNIEGHVRRIVNHMQSPAWIFLWPELNLRLATFREVGLIRSSSDAEIWDTCQRLDMVLITNNRNNDGPDSLEETILRRNELTSLPVLTLSDADRIFDSAEYLDNVVETAIDMLLDLNARRGAGRLYLP